MQRGNITWNSPYDTLLYFGAVRFNLPLHDAACSRVISAKIIDLTPR
jgi:hypothetical protein